MAGPAPARKLNNHSSLNPTDRKDLPGGQVGDPGIGPPMWLSGGHESLH